MWDKLPAELCTDILSRLPVKTLIQCTTLSKHFNSFITSPHFITAHISKSKNAHLFLRYLPRKKKHQNQKDNKEVFIFEPDDENFSGFSSVGVVLPFSDCVCPGEWFNILGSVNGVICLSSDFHGKGTTIIMWNPSVRKYVTLPEPIYTIYTCGDFESACGFGYDSVSNDFKVVRVVRVVSGTTEVEVYSLRSGSWRALGDGPSYRIRQGYFSSSYNSCCLNGSVHWVGFYEETFVTVTFNLASEVFGIIEMPGCFRGGKGKLANIFDYLSPFGHMSVQEDKFTHLFVEECMGMLALVEVSMKGKFGIWVMREYGVLDSWMKLVDADVYKRNLLAPPQAVGFRNNGHVIVVKGPREMYRESHVLHLISLIDPAQHRETFLGVITGALSSFCLSTYGESMALFKEGKTVTIVKED